MKVRFLAAVLAAVVLLAQPAAAQEPFPVAREVAALRADVDVLKRRVAELERLVNPAPANTAPAQTPVAAPAGYDCSTGVCRPAAAPTYTAPAFAPAAGSACAGGSCPAPARFAPFGGRFRR